LLTIHGESDRMVKGILSNRQHDFLINYPKGRPLKPSERQLSSLIARKTRCALKELNLIFERLPKPYLLFSEEKEISYWKPIEEIVIILFFKNYQLEYRRRMKDKSKRQIDIDIIRQRTRKQLIEMIDSVLQHVKLP